jgi:MFS transporter, Spinster family, sphingosine-1-phosphate transporter
VLSLLIQPMKSSLHLSDTRLSLLQGMAFTLSYVALGPLFGRRPTVTTGATSSPPR